MSAAALFTPSYLLMCLAALCFFTSQHLLTPSFPIYLSSQLPDAVASMGTIMASFTLASLLLRPWIGKWSDESGTRHWMILGAALFTVIPLLYPYTQQVPMLMVLRVLHGCGLALFYTASHTALSYTIPASRRAEGFSHFSNAIKLAMAIGPGLGIAMAQSGQFNQLFWLASAFGLACLVASLLTPACKPEAADASAKPVKGKLLNGRAVFPGLIMASSSVAFGTLIPFIPMLLAEKHLSHVGGTFYLIYAGTLIFSRALTGPISDRVDRAVVIAFGLAGVGLSLLLFWLCHEPWQYYCAAALYGLAAGTVQPSLMALAVDRAEPQEKGSSMATFTMLNDLGLTVGTFLTGTLGPTIGFSDTMLVILAITLVGLAVFASRQRVAMPVIAKNKP